MVLPRCYPCSGVFLCPFMVSASYSLWTIAVDPLFMALNASISPERRLHLKEIVSNCDALLEMSELQIELVPVNVC